MWHDFGESCTVVSLGSLCPRTDTLPTRDVNELGRTFPGSLSFPAPEPNLPEVAAWSP
jgi:hypothetical protein